MPKSPLDGLCGIFEAPTYGRLTVLSLDADADKSEADDASLDILRRYKASEPFGKTWQRKPTLLAVFRETMTWYIFELYHIKEDIYLGVGVILFDRAKDPSQIVRVPVYVSRIQQAIGSAGTRPLTHALLDNLHQYLRKI